MRNVLLTALLAMLPALLPAAPPTDAATRALARDVLRELIEINTSESGSKVTAAAQAAPHGLRVYQVSGDACERDDQGEHGPDERISVQAFARVDFYYRFLHTLLDTE